MLNVAHFRSLYLGLTETFIYQYLTNLRTVKPFVFTLNIENRERFPFPEIHMALYSPFFLGSILSRLGRKLLNKDFKLESLIKKLNIAVVHAHFGHEGYYLLPVRKKTGIPLVTTFYGFDMSILPRREEWRRNYKELFRNGDMFLVEGSHMKNELVRIGCPEEKIRIQHIAVNPAAIPFRTRRPAPSEEKAVILFCGRFSEKKGLLYALQAIEAVAKRFDSIEFRIIGDGELRQEVLDYISNAHLNKWVTLLGMKSHQEVLQEISNADIFLAPSVTAVDGDSEGGAPTILIEAQAAGLPIVSTFHADIPEVVVDGKTGFLVKERDASAIAAKLEHLLRNRGLWEPMGRAGRQHVELNYNISSEVMKLEQIYSSLAGGSK